MCTHQVQVGPKTRALTLDEDEAPFGQESDGGDEDEDSDREGLVEKRKQEQLQKLAMRPTTIKPSRQVWHQLPGCMGTAIVLRSERALLLRPCSYFCSSLSCSPPF